jgi:hypothetical protein
MHQFDRSGKFSERQMQAKKVLSLYPTKSFDFASMPSILISFDARASTNIAFFSIYTPLLQTDHSQYMASEWLYELLCSAKTCIFLRNGHSMFSNAGAECRHSFRLGTSH